MFQLKISLARRVRKGGDGGGDFTLLVPSFFFFFLKTFHLIGEIEIAAAWQIKV